MQRAKTLRVHAMNAIRVRIKNPPRLLAQAMAGTGEETVECGLTCACQAAASDAAGASVRKP
jgi:hypothetical protein